MPEADTNQSIDTAKIRRRRLRRIFVPFTEPSAIFHMNFKKKGACFHIFINLW